MNAPVLEAVDLRLGRADGFALGPVSLALAPGEFLAVLGPNGAGKSSLLASLAGLLRPASGRALLLGEPLAARSRREVARLLGYLPQQPGLPPGLRVAEAVALGRFARLRGLGFLGPEDRAAVDRALEATELTRLAERPLERLSGGERQRALLATVLAQEPRALLLDEPDRGLDARHQGRLFGMLRDLARAGLAVLAATHDLNLAAASADRLLLLDKGQVLRQGPAEEVLDPDLLRQVYGPALTLTRHPATGRPAVLPATGDAA